MSWESSYDRSYLYGARGSSCERAVWEQAFSTEYLVSRGLDTANTFIDLLKAYEKVQHGQLIAAARRLSFPLHHLRLCLQV